MRLSRLVSRLGLVALGGMALLAMGTAVASAPTVKSTVTITSGEGAKFTGKVNSAKKACRAGRTVKLYRESGSSRINDPVAGTAKTNASGTWTMDGSFLAGVYYAQVLAVIVHSHGMSYRCGVDLSIRQHF